MEQRVVTAEQTATNRYWLQGTVSDREIQLTVRLQIPEQDGADVGVSALFGPVLPEPWEEVLHQRLYAGVHGGLAAVDAPLPSGGIGVQIMHLIVVPPIEPGSDEDEVQRLGDTLEALAAGTVSSLWTGLIRLSAPDSPRPGRAA